MAEHADNLPPVPAERHITPAPEDYANPPAFGNLLWPILWLGVAAACYFAVEAAGWIEQSTQH